MIIMFLGHVQGKIHIAVKALNTFLPSIPSQRHFRFSDSIRRPDGIKSRQKLHNFEWQSNVLNDFIFFYNDTW